MLDKVVKTRSGDGLCFIFLHGLAGAGHDWTHWIKNIGKTYIIRQLKGITLLEHQ